MSREYSDARLEELRFLVKVEREGAVNIRLPDHTREREMVISLYADGYFNSIGEKNWNWNGTWEDLDDLTKKIHQDHWSDLARLLGGQDTLLRISFKGRVRMAQLRDELRRDRLHDPSGILTDGRHLERDLTVSILFATEKKPVSLAFLDMNGMKGFNKTLGYRGADVVIRAYLYIVASAIGDDAEAYRVHGGGDEVVIRMPGSTLVQGAERTRVILRRLNAQEVRADGSGPLQLAACVGVVETHDFTASAASLIERAGHVVLQRAKDDERKTDTTCLLAVEDEDV